MQILKDDIRNSIVRAALIEFKHEGYLQASMRQIAQAAGMTSGNIYRYFKNKEELFDAIVQPVYEQYTVYMLDIRQKIGLSYVKEGADTQGYFNKIESTLIELFKAYSTELMILLNRSEGSKYEGVKFELVNLTFSILEGVFIAKKGKGIPLSKSDTALARMLASTIVEGLCLILRENEEGDTLRMLIDQFLFLYAEGISVLIKQMVEKRNHRS
jgi:AcrR family transcriptional regulator